MADAALYTKARSELGGATAALRAAKDPQAKMAAITTVMRILGQLAANAPTDQLRAAWLAEYRRLEPKAATLRAQVTYDPPGAVLRSLDALSDEVLGFSTKVLEGAGDIVKAAPKALEALPWLVLAGLIVAAVVVVKVGPQLLKARKK